MDALMRFEINMKKILITLKQVLLFLISDIHLQPQQKKR